MRGGVAKGMVVVVVGVMVLFEVKGGDGRGKAGKGTNPEVVISSRPDLMAIA